MPINKLTLSDLIRAYRTNEDWEGCGMKPGIQIVKRRLTGLLTPLEEWLGGRHERWQTKIGNCGVRPQAMGPVETGWTKYINCCTWFFRSYIQPARESQNNCRLLGTCGESHERLLVATVEALLLTVNSDSPERLGPCDVQTLINSHQLGKACGIDGIPNECLRHIPRRLLVHITAFDCHIFCYLRRRRKW